jgi:YD repeat-containing protein
MIDEEPRQQSKSIYDASGRLVQVIDVYGQHTRMSYFGRPQPDEVSAALELTEALDEALAWPDSDADFAAYTTLVYEGAGYHWHRTP